MSKRKTYTISTPTAKAWDYLQMDGGWLTAEGIAMEVGIKTTSVYRSMFRWRKAGYVESRSVPLAYIGGTNASGRNRSHMESRQEWRTL